MRRGGSSTDQFFFQLLLHIQGFSFSLKSDFRGMPRIPALIYSNVGLCLMHSSAQDQALEAGGGFAYWLCYLVLGP